VIVIELRQLAALLAVGEHGGFSAAAKALYTVQSNVSAHVQHLERELGVTLVDRGRGVLTPAGEVVAERARRIQHELEAIKVDVLALAGEVSGEVRIGVISTVARWLVPAVLSVSQNVHSRVRIIVVEASTVSLLPQVASGRLDLAIVNLPVADADLATDMLFSERQVLVVPSEHPLAQDGPLPFSALEDVPLLLPGPSSSARQELEEEARLAGVHLTAQAEIDGQQLIATLAFQGYGPAILPATAVASWIEGPWRQVTVEGLPRRSVGIVRRRRGLPSAPARAITDIVVEVVTEQVKSHDGLEVL